MDDLPEDDPMASDSTEHFLALQAASLELLDEVRELHASLAESPDPGGTAERRLQDCLQRRDALAAEIGQALMRVLARGVHLVPASVAADPAPSTPPEAGEPADPTHGATDAPVPPVPERADVPAPDVEPKGEPAPIAALVALAEQGLGPDWNDEPPNAVAHARLVQLAHAVGEPRELTTLEDACSQVHRLVDAVRRIDAWLDHPSRDQQSMLGLVSSLARHVQVEVHVDLPTFETDALGKTFSRMTAWSKAHRPGFVPGLSRTNDPDRGSWLEDARAWWTELVGAPTDSAGQTPERAIERIQSTLDEGVADDAALVALVRDAVAAGLPQSDPRLIRVLAPHQERLRGAAGLKTLKTQLRDAGRDAPDDTGEGGTEIVPDDWPLHEVTSGRRAVVVGGDPRPHAAERIQEAFGFREVLWEENDTRRVLGLADRIRGGNVDLVIALRAFIGHSDSDTLRPACKEVGVPFCLVDTGYGVAQVRLAIERFCSDLLEDPPSEAVG